jgi:hypothetical protein
VLSAEMIDTGDCYATFKLLIPLLANMAIIGFIRFGEKSNADGEAYFRRVPTTIFCGTVIFRRLGMGKGESGIGNRDTISRSAFRIPNSPLPVPLSPVLLMKLVTESLYPCLGASPIAGINCVRLVRRRDESLKWRFTFCRILLKQR